METSVQIANQILAVVNRAVAREITVEQSGEQTKVLWDKARTLGIEQEVDTILQTVSQEEMAEAMRKVPV